MKIKKVAVITGGRAEFGILLPVIQELRSRKNMQCFLIVTGSHLAFSQGNTVEEIYEQSVQIDAKVPMLLDGDTNEHIAYSMGLGLIGITKELERLKPDLVLVLGDRYEIFAACTAAMALHIPIGHIAGGETDLATTLDGNIRNAITKLAHLHFVSADAYGKRVLAMGEEAHRIFNVGALSLDGVKKGLLSREELEKSLGISFNKKIFVITYMPVGVGDSLDENLYELDQLLKALSEFKDQAQMVFTLANADARGRIINQKVKDFAELYPDMHVFQSLGKIRYRSLVNIADAVIGNSSSGVIEVPSFQVGTVNIGNRQAGRLHQDSVIDAQGNKDAIIKAVNQILYDEAFKKTIQNTKNLYGGGDSSKKIADVLASTEIDTGFLQKRLVY